MADEDVTVSGVPTPLDLKRKLETEAPPPSDEPTSVNGDAAVDSEAKRPRIDEEATKNGYQEKADEPEMEDAEESILEDTKAEDGLNRASLGEDANHFDLENIETKDGQKGEGESPEATNNDAAGATGNEVIPSGSHTLGVEQSSDEIHSLSNAEELNKGEPQGDVPEPKELQEPSKESHDQPVDVSQPEDHSYAEQGADRPISRKMEVPNNKVGVIIGKAGETVQTLQKNSGARIQITKDADADPSSTTRIVEIIGSLESINKAEKLIKDVIVEADAGGSPSLVARGFSTSQSSAASGQIQIQVPNEKVGLIIGKGGETIKGLQAKSGARIQLIPQHLPEGDQSKERTVRVTGDKKQIEMAREMIKEAMNQPLRSSAPSSGYNQQQPFRPRGTSQWGGYRGHSAQPAGYDQYRQRGPYPPQNPHYSSSYANYPPQQMPPRSTFGWEQRPPTNMQGPHDHSSYDYYGGHRGGYTAPPSNQMQHTRATGHQVPSLAGNNYGQPQGPDYGQPAPYSQTAPPSQSYGHGYGEQNPALQPYGGHGAQPPVYPQGTNPSYGQQDQYGKPPSYNMPPQQGSYAQPYVQPTAVQPGDVPYQAPIASTAQSYAPNPQVQQPYPYASAAPTQQGYPPYGTTTPGSDSYNNPAAAAHGYQPGGQPVSAYPSTGVQPQVTGYGQYPAASQPGYAEQVQAVQNYAGGYGYQGAADPAYGSSAAVPVYGAPASGQPAAYSSQPMPTQAVYDQSYGNVPVGYGKSVSPHPGAVPQAVPQYDASQMYGSGQR